MFDLSLSLSLVFSLMFPLWYDLDVPPLAIVVGSYDVSPPLLSCDELSFPIEVILSD